MKKEFNILAGESDDLIEYLEGLKKGIKRAGERTNELFMEELKKNIKENANNINSGHTESSKEASDLHGVRYDVANANEVITVDSERTILRSTEQSVTYAEFGTGIVGASAPYILAGIDWGYDLNDYASNEKASGVWYFTSKYTKQSKVSTKGIPAFATYYHSYDITKDKIEEIAKKAFMEVLNERN